jgi:hypothetical protein
LTINHYHYYYYYHNYNQWIPKAVGKEPVGKGVASSGSSGEMSGEKFDEKYSTK